MSTEESNYCSDTPNNGAKLYTHLDMWEMRQNTLEAAAQRVEEQYKIISASGFKSLSLRNTTMQYVKAIRSLKFTR